MKYVLKVVLEIKKYILLILVISSLGGEALLVHLISIGLAVTITGVIYEKHKRAYIHKNLKNGYMRRCKYVSY